MIVIYHWWARDGDGRAGAPLGGFPARHDAVQP
jgi:hypothetical protein